MTAISLRLSVKAKNWRMNDDSSSASDVEFSVVRKKALDRDKYICQGCGFKASKWMEVHHIDDDHSNNSVKNLVTTCSYCHMCQHIGLAGKNNEATIVWLPEISQAHLHHIVRATQVAQRWTSVSTSTRQMRPDMMREAQKVGEGAEAVIAALREREDEADSRLKTSSLLDLANIMLSMPDDVYERREDFLHGFKMLPFGVRQQDGKNQMDMMVDSWMQPGGPFVNLKPSSWYNMFKMSLGAMK
jgi:intracellular multiplication protein IcmJ